MVFWLERRKTPKSRSMMMTGWSWLFYSFEIRSSFCSLSHTYMHCFPFKQRTVCYRQRQSRNTRLFLAENKTYVRKNASWFRQKERDLEGWLVFLVFPHHRLTPLPFSHWMLRRRFCFYNLFSSYWGHWSHRSTLRDNRRNAHYSFFSVFFSFPFFQSFNYDG